MEKLRFILIAGIITLCLSLGTLLTLSLVPYLSIIGIVSGVALSLLLCCGVRLAIAYTYTNIALMKNRANIIAHGEVVSFLHNGELVHLSAIHETAKLPQTEIREIAPPSEDPPDPYVDDETLIDLYKNGQSLRTIAQSTGLTYYRVQKAITTYRQQGNRKHKI